MPPPGVEAPLPWTDPHAEERTVPEEHAGVGPPIAVAEPADERQRYIIDMLASYVIKDGCTFEQVGAEPWLGFNHDVLLQPYKQMSRDFGD